MLPLQDTVPGRHPPVAVLGLILVNSAVFLVELALPEETLERVFRLFGVVPAGLAEEPERWGSLVTHMFLHGGWMHVLGNLWTLWIFGDNVEDRMGTRRFLVFYFLCGLAAGVVHCLLNPGSTVPTIGASGAISGVMGAYFLLFPRARLILMMPVLFYPVFFELPAFTYLAYWLATQILSGTVTTLLAPEQTGGVAWWAHVGGFAAGVFLHRFFIRRGRSWRRYQPDECWIEGAWTYAPRRPRRTVWE
jgi:membrane associated rhomboid family serine protease